MHQFMATSLLEAPEDEQRDVYAQRILDAAAEQFHEFGLGRTSLDRIASAAGVSRGTLFNRFPNRNALLVAVARRELAAFLAEVDAEISAAGTPEEALVAGVVAVGHALARHRMLQRLLVTDPERVVPALTTNGDGMIALMRAQVARYIIRARDDGMRVVGDPDVLAEVLVRIVHSLTLVPQTAIPLGDDAQLAEFARTNLVPLLCGRGH